MANSKVVYDGKTLIDISKDTVTPETLAKGATAHDSSGEPITGTMELGDYEGAINAHNESKTAHQDIREDLNGKVSKSGDTMSGSLEVPSVGADGYVVYPDDGYLKLTGNNLTGAIKITLPINIDPQPNTTIKFRLNIFNWRERGAIDYVISGYLYSRWMNVSAHCIAPNTYSNSDLPVSFGFENGKYVCIVGTPTTVWHYPSFGIADILVGHQNNDYDKWASGWKIELTTEALTEVHVTLNSTNVTYDIQKQINDLNDSVPQNVVMYTAQELSEAQKAQVRNNIAAICEEDTLQCIDNHDKSDTAHSDIRESISDLQETVDNLELQSGQDGKDGEDGKDGISATHSWNGTVLTITSASGTSSADLKGDKGDKGETGAAGANGKDGKDGTNGTNGKDGYTPQKGVDYWTAADLQAMVQAVIANLPNAEGVGF